jgi:hypothetical protein
MGTPSYEGKEVYMGMFIVSFSLRVVSATG